jgi:hypothetical protein
VETLPIISDHNKIVEFVSHVISAPQVDCPVYHHFKDGVYFRETHIPAGTIAVGKYHRYESLNLLVQGTISVRKTDGTVYTLTAPASFLSPPGFKLGYAHDDVIFVNVHHTQLTDIDKIEETYIDASRCITNEAQIFMETLYTKEISI